MACVNLARRRRTDTWLSFQGLNYSSSGSKPRDYKEMDIVLAMKKTSSNSQRTTIPTSREISLFIIAFL
jgi:hypothetical protein